MGGWPRRPLACRDGVSWFIQGEIKHNRTRQTTPTAYEHSHTHTLSCILQAGDNTHSLSLCIYPLTRCSNTDITVSRLGRGHQIQDPHPGRSDRSANVRRTDGIHARLVERDPSSPHTTPLITLAPSHAPFHTPRTRLPFVSIYATAPLCIHSRSDDHCYCDWLCSKYKPHRTS